MSYVVLWLNPDDGNPEWSVAYPSYPHTARGRQAAIEDARDVAEVHGSTAIVASEITRFEGGGK